MTSKPRPWQKWAELVNDLADEALVSPPLVGITSARLDSILELCEEFLRDARSDLRDHGLQHREALDVRLWQVVVRLLSAIASVRAK